MKNNLEILGQSNAVCRMYRMVLLKFYVCLYHKTEKKMWGFYIFGHNFCSKTYFQMKIARLAYRDRILITKKFDADRLIIAWYIGHFLIIWISENKIKSLGDSPD